MSDTAADIRRRSHGVDVVDAVATLADSSMRAARVLSAIEGGARRPVAMPADYRYVLKKLDTAVVARKTSNIRITDIRHRDGEWEFRSYNEFVRAEYGDDPHDSGTCTRSDVDSNLTAPLLLSASAWEDDLADVYDRLHGFKEPRP